MTPPYASSGRRSRHRPRKAAGLVAATLILVACTDPAEPADPASGTGTGVLAGVCPDPIVAQTGWWPQAEHAALYHLIGDEYTVDTDRLRVTAPLTVAGEQTGVSIEVRAGGPAIGFQLPNASLYADDDITMAVVDTATAVAGSADTPVLGVMAVLDIFPTMIMWDPETYPDIRTIADIGQADITVTYFEDAPYMDFLIDEGILRREQVDGSYDGQPARWVAEDGAIAQQGFASSEPYTYENELEAWNKPVEFQLVHELGYEIYDMLSIRADQQDELAPCLEEFIPMVQQSLVDYVADPAGTNALIVELADTYQGHPYTLDKADWSRQQMLDLGIISNAGTGTIGDVDPDRVGEVVEIVTPIYAGQGVAVEESLAAGDIATNAYIDQGIGLP